MDPVFGHPQLNDRVRDTWRGEGVIVKAGTTAQGAATYQVKFDRSGLTDWYQSIEIVSREDMSPQPTQQVIALLSDQQTMDEARSVVALGATMNDLGKWALAKGLAGSIQGNADDIDWGEVFDAVAESVDPIEHGQMDL